MCATKRGVATLTTDAKTTTTNGRSVTLNCPNCRKTVAEADGESVLSSRGGFKFWFPQPVGMECRCGQRLILYPTGRVVRYNAPTKAHAPILPHV